MSYANFIARLTVASVIGSAFFSSAAEARRYKFYLDPNRAEEILAGIAINQPLYQDEWLNLVGDRRDQTIAVRRGDNLWKISRRAFGNPRLWRKLWQVNSDLSNPHELEIGRILRYYREGGEQAANTIPLIKLIPGAAGQMADIDEDSLINRNIRNRFLPPFFVLDADEIRGEISGAYTERDGLTELDETYVRMTTETMPPIGTRYSIVRYERELRDRSTLGAPEIGSLVSLIGEVSIVGNGANLARAEITGQYAVIRRGDWLIDLKKPLTFGELYNPPENLRARIVLGEQTDTKMFGQGQIVLLNKGTVDGMRDGLLFRVYHDQDMRTESDEDVEPSYKGEVQVIAATELASVAYVIRNSLPLFIGDLLVPAQTFTDPKPRAGRPIITLEFD